MTRWWGGTGVSVMFHAALFVMLIYVAAQHSLAAPLPSIASTPAKLIYVVRPWDPGAGNGTPTADAPRKGLPPKVQSVQLVAPSSITNVDPPPVALVPAIISHDVDTPPGAPVAIDGLTPGKGPGGGFGGGRGPGAGPGEGPGIDNVYTAGVGGVSEPQLIHEVRPNYTVDAMRGKIMGVVIMEVDVLANGSVDPQRIRITHSLDAGLDREAVIAVRQWRFRPSTLRGQPVTSRVIVELRFMLR